MQLRRRRTCVHLAYGMSPNMKSSASSTPNAQTSDLLVTVWFRSSSLKMRRKPKSRTGETGRRGDGETGRRGDGETRAPNFRGRQPC